MEKQALARHDDIEDYDAHDLSDDPFRSPSPPSKKRKDVEKGLGVDEEVSIQKRARAPAIKLDEDRLLGPSGIPRLRTRARNLKLKGKGHEFSDAGRLLQFYQMWLDDLYPKAKFLDALTMVEKAGHKRKMVTARSAWINEGKPNISAPLDDSGGKSGTKQTLPVPAIISKSPTLGCATGAEINRPTTPPELHGLQNDDIYNATPRQVMNRTIPIRNDEPAEDELDALIAEADGSIDGEQGRPKMPMVEPKTAGLGDKYADDEEAMQEMDGLW